MSQLNSAFSVKFNEGEGTLLRLVGLIERRQFTITGLVFVSDNGINEAVFRVKTTTIEHDDHDHRLDIVLKQIEKIENVTGVIRSDLEL